MKSPPKSIYKKTPTKHARRARPSPVFEKLYNEVKSGNEAQKSIDSNSKEDYREKLEEELKELRESEMWQAGAAVRKLRPRA